MVSAWPCCVCVCTQEGETDQELLLDSAVPAVGSGHGGLIELPLSYNLTGHTGSLMYMAPEVYKVRAAAAVHPAVLSTKTRLKLPEG